MRCFLLSALPSFIVPPRKRTNEHIEQLLQCSAPLSCPHVLVSFHTRLLALLLA